MQHVDFSSNASIYDRRHGAVLALGVARQLASLAEIRSRSRVLDIGAGTGRVAISFAALGYETVALDPSLSMLNELRQKAPDTEIHAVAGEAERLPFRDGTFDAVILARVLYLMADWQKVLEQAYEVSKPGGSLLHEWGNGEADEEWVQIREKARTLFEEAGVKHPFHPGARSEAEVDDFLPKLGFIRKNELQTGPGPSMTLREFVQKIVSGESSYIWNVPKDVQESCLPRLKDWTESTFDLDEFIPIPRELRWAIYRKE
jgi:ubiquinone/menaquinone biosynthesis C-methylase UbiE